MKKEIHILIKKYLEQTINSGELKSLELWLSENESNKQEFKTILSSYKKIIAIEYLRSKKICNKPIKRVNRILIRFAAAAIIGLFSTLIFILYTTHENGISQDRIVNESNVISPKAIPVKQNDKITISTAGQVLALTEIITNDSCRPKGVVVTKNSLDYSKLKIASDIKKEVLVEAIIPKGETFNIKLSDGTSVWINSDTKIIYPTYFIGNTRRIKVEGEIYLEVAHDTKRPFIVETANHEITVLGTRFNVLAYPENKEIVTTLVEGSVAVDAYPPLVPNEQLSINKSNNSIVVQKVNTSLYTSWISGTYHFNKITFEELAVKFNRVYGVELFFKNEDSKKKLFTGSIHKDIPYSEMFELIVKTTNINYTIEEKEKIIIW